MNEEKLKQGETAPAPPTAPSAAAPAGNLQDAQDVQVASQTPGLELPCRLSEAPSHFLSAPPSKDTDTANDVKDKESQKRKRPEDVCDRKDPDPQVQGQGQGQGQVEVDIGIDIGIDLATAYSESEDDEDDEDGDENSRELSFIRSLGESPPPLTLGGIAVSRPGYPCPTPGCLKVSWNVTNRACPLSLVPLAIICIRHTFPFPSTTLTIHHTPLSTIPSSTIPPSLP